jgi:hypothetical protein
MSSRSVILGRAGTLQARCDRDEDEREGAAGAQAASDQVVGPVAAVAC